MSRMGEWRARLWLAGIATALTFAVTCIAGEVAIRYRERHRDTVPGTAPLLYYRHGRLGLALVRDYDYFGWMRTNRQGFRGLRPVPKTKTPGVMRILAVGGSTTFDIFVSSDSAAWPARLERWLQQLDTGRRFEVINAGVPGYTMGQDLIRLETELYQYEPDLLILYQGHNDLFANLRGAGQQPDTSFDPTPGAIPSITPWGAWLERHSLLYGKIAIGLQRRGLSRPPRRTQAAPEQTSQPARETNDGAAQFGTAVSVYLAVARALNIPVVVPEVVQISGTRLEEPDSAVNRTWRASVPFASSDVVLRGYQRYNAELERVCQQYGVPFIRMQQMGIAGERFYVPDDPIHFNDQGADRFAEGLARALIRDSLLRLSRN